MCTCKHTHTHTYPKQIPPGKTKNPSVSLCQELFLFLPLVAVIQALKSFWKQFSQRAWCLPLLLPQHFSPQTLRPGEMQELAEGSPAASWPGMELASNCQAGTTMPRRSLDHSKCFLCRAGSGRTFLKCKGQQFYLLQLAIFRRF